MIEGVPSRAQMATAIRALRAERKETQTIAAHSLGLTQASLSNYENGKRDLPGPVMVALAARYLGGDVNALLAIARGEVSASRAMNGKG